MPLKIRPYTHCHFSRMLECIRSCLPGWQCKLIESENQKAMALQTETWVFVYKNERRRKEREVEDERTRGEVIQHFMQHVPALKRKHPNSHSFHHRQPQQHHRRPLSIYYAKSAPLQQKGETKAQAQAKGQLACVPWDKWHRAENKECRLEKKAGYQQSTLKLTLSVPFFFFVLFFVFGGRFSFKLLTTLILEHPPFRYIVIDHPPSQPLAMGVQERKGIWSHAETR